MSTRSLGLSEALQTYLLDAVVREPEVLARLRAETEKLKNSGMQISPEQGRFMQWLVQLTGARRCLEVGVFTGYSSLAVALSLPDDGRVVACDVSDEWTRIARRYYREASVEHKIELRLGHAVETLDSLLADGHEGSFDFAFIDADKGNYGAYYERALRLLRKGGLVAVDNALWGGKVADPGAADADTCAIRDLNELAGRDPRVDACLLPVGDGLLLARKLG